MTRHGRRPPVVVCGMHRSGTAMLCTVLEELGFFVGWRLDENLEARFFIRLNDWALRQANASWDDPRNFTFLRDFHLAHLEQVFRAALGGIRRLEFLGPTRTIRYRSVEDLHVPWAFKDPRNTFTLPLWKRIFPAAKVVHVARNPIDVATSLAERERRQQQAFRRTAKKKLAELLLTRAPIYCGSVRVQDLRQGVRLWEEYLLRMEDVERELAEPALHVRYEDFVARPEEGLEALVGFLGLDPSREEIRRALARIRPGRDFAFLGSPELVELYDEVKTSGVVRRWRYGALR